ncbi:MAG: SIS domain-containing protein [Gemmatimonadetes bacterium]|nr:SIS domain-containing protein [Gemmatimonadota bacterium]
MMNYFEEYFRELGQRLSDANAAQLLSLCDVLKSSRGRKIVVVGNGGSAAIASHVAVDLTKAAGLRAMTFNDADLITCFGNDFGYEQWVEKAIDYYGDAGDVGVFVSSSGRSPNILNGARRATEKGLRVVTLSGFDAENPLRTVGEVNLWVNSRNYNVVETTHQSWLISAVDQIAGVEPVS